MDDDFNAVNGTTYSVSVTVIDGYGQTSTQTFSWQFNANTAGAIISSVPGPGGKFAQSGFGTLGLNGVGQNPTTGPRTDKFSVDIFWHDVALLPGGQAAENWLAGKNGQVQWGWLFSVTHGRWENQSDGSIVPVVHIPTQNDEADAAQAFVTNITQSWVVGFADYSKIPINGTPSDWQQYIKERYKNIGDAAIVGRELLLAGLSIANEGVDWVITINEAANESTYQAAAIDLLGLLPIVSISTVKLFRKLNGTTTLLATLPADQVVHVKNILATFENSKVYKAFTVQQGKLVVQRSDILWNSTNVFGLLDLKKSPSGVLLPRAPKVRNIYTGKDEVIALHHVLRREDTPLVEVLGTQNRYNNGNGGPLHIPGPRGDGMAGAINSGSDWDSFRATYWHDRLQDAITTLQVPAKLLDQYRSILIKQNYTLPF